MLGSYDGRLGVLSLLAALEDGEDEYSDREAVLAVRDAVVSFTIATATVSPDTEDGNSEVTSIHLARGRLAEDFRLAPGEVASLLALAQQRTLGAMPTGDAVPSMQLLVLDDVARRTAGALDLSSGIAARRLFAEVSGVTRTRAGESGRGVPRCRGRVSARQDELLAEPIAVEALPARRTERVSSRVLDCASGASPSGGPAYATIRRPRWSAS